MHMHAELVSTKNVTCLKEPAVRCAILSQGPSAAAAQQYACQEEHLGTRL